MALPALLVVLGMAVAVVVSVGAELRCVDAARAAARVAARGEQDGQVRSAGLELAPPGSRVTVEHRGHRVQVTVTGAIRPFPLLPAFGLRASAVAEVEQP